MSAFFLRFRTGLLLPVAMLLAGCSASSMIVEEPHSRATPGLEFEVVDEPASAEFDEPALDESDGPLVSPAVSALREEIDGWMGTPYLWGGTDMNGVDCSAFVQNVFQDALNVELPRTTALQRYSGTSIERDELSFADLVFFSTSKKTRHVGIYLGDGDFAHASSSQGVTVSNLSQSYWDEAYTYSRRPLSSDVLEPEPYRAELESEEPDDELPPEAPTPQRRRARRAGW